ncbi:MAG: hypothetical protein P4L70_07080 [Parasulfuritortus sp.]|jgi:hypothetical protein|nr:hypothetical protein [Parasulfuritortus sp.]
MSGYNEDAYKEARESAIGLACPFERALLSRCVVCFKAHRLLLAEREAISCTEQHACDLCQRFHIELHHNARFALHTEPDQPWPFGKEIRAQCGGVLGLAEVLEKQPGLPNDVALLVNEGILKFGEIGNFPYSEIMRAVVHFEPRRRKQ